MSFLHTKGVNLHILFGLNTWSRGLNANFALGNYLSGGLKLMKNADPDKYKYSGYDIGFNSCLQFSWIDGSWGKNVIIFGVDNNSSVHIDGKNKNILALSNELAQGLYNTAITVEDKYLINFTESGKRFVLSLYHNRSNSFFIC